jgi:hypothetical protein
LYFVNQFYEYKVFEVDISLSLFELSMYYSIKVLLCMHIILFYFYVIINLYPDYDGCEEILLIYFKCVNVCGYWSILRNFL